MLMCIPLPMSINLIPGEVGLPASVSLDCKIRAIINVAIPTKVYSNSTSPRINIVRYIDFILLS